MYQYKYNTKMTVNEFIDENYDYLCFEFASEVQDPDSAQKIIYETNYNEVKEFCIEIMKDMYETFLISN